MIPTEKQTYVSPVVLNYGLLTQKILGSGGNTAEGCSSGEYEETSADEG